MRENLLREGDYVPDGFGGFVRLEGHEALLARALYKMTCCRGAFPFLPQLGSQLRQLTKERPAARDSAARLYAAQALEGMGLRVVQARVRLVGDDQAEVAVWLEKDGRLQQMEVTV